MSPKFKILDKKNIHDGFFKMNEVTLKYKKYDGNWSNEIKRELFGGAQVSAVLPYDPVNKKIVLIQQFRPGTISKDNQNYLDEIVAGIIDSGETPEDTAKRECLEETGCEVSNLTSIQGYFPAPGSSESFYNLFLGEVIAPDKEIIRGLENENEDILVKSYSFDEVKTKMNKKEILNGLTLIALQWFFLNIERS